MDINIAKNKYNKYKMKYLNLKKIEKIIKYNNIKINMEQIGGKVENIVYFHYPCNDGLAAAWVAQKKLKEDNVQFELRNYSHGDKIDVTMKNVNIYFLDMAPSIDIYQELKENNSVYVLDHHKSNVKDYAGLPDKNVRFDMNLSGVGLAWEWFYPNEEMPLFVKMIQGRDLFKFDYDNINEFSETLNLEMDTRRSIKEQLKIFDDLFYNKHKLTEYIEFGEPLLRKKMIKIEALAERNIKNIYLYEGHKLCMVNCDSELGSDLGSNLTQRPECDFAILWNYDHVYEKYNISMRSSDKVDVSIICKKFGGGGHPNASGCKLNVHPVEVFGKEKL
jgi:oligoribonuclease NrnB/cAMP/cGMP phosphodiesterase (DHH superfamily)